MTIHTCRSPLLTSYPSPTPIQAGGGGSGEERGAEVQLAQAVPLLQEEELGGAGACRRKNHMDGALLWEVTALRNRRMKRRGRC